MAGDPQTGEEVWFDNHVGGIRVEHLLAATALAPIFAPIEVDGRTLCDAGLANNLPRRLDPDLPPMILGHAAFRAAGHERFLKALDFSTSVLDERAARGRRDMDALLALVGAAPRDHPLAVVSHLSSTDAGSPGESRVAS